MGTRRSGRQGRRLKKLDGLLLFFGRHFPSIECELQITYSADSKEISLSAKDGYFDVKRSGKLTQSYDGDTEESAYEKVE